MNTPTTTRVRPDSRWGGALHRTRKPCRKPWMTVCAAAVLLGLPCRGQAACATPSFHLPPPGIALPAATHILAADLNNNGMTDLAITIGGGANKVVVILDPAAGGSASPSIFDVGNTPVSVATGDFNGDGKPDLAVANLNGNIVSVLLGDGSGGFGAATNFPVTGSSFSVAVADLNGDGKADIVVTNMSPANSVSVLLGDGSGAFGAKRDFAVGADPNFVVAGDFNGDGKPDLAVSNYSSNNVSVLLGDGSGGFGTAIDFAVHGNPTSIALGDLNGDGHTDLAVTNGASNDVSVLLGDGSGGFGTATNFSVGTEPVAIAVADFNGDGTLDLATGNGHGSNVSVRLGNGSGGFGAATNFSLSGNPVALAAGEFDGDAKVDLVVARDDNTVSQLTNDCGGIGAYCIANGDCDSGICCANACQATACPTHDAVVLAAKPINVTIPFGNPIGSNSLTKMVKLQVRNADPATSPTSGFTVTLKVDDSGCGGGVASAPNFASANQPPQSSIFIANGKTKTAKVGLTINASAFSSFNHNAPHRCTLVFKTSGAYNDANPSNDTLPVELNVVDRNDPDQTAVHETTIASVNPVTLTIPRLQTSTSKNVTVKVGNADANEPAGHAISGVAADGTCPANTVGAVDLGNGPGNAVTVVGGAKKGGKMVVTAASTVSTPNKLSPQRCVATVSAVGPNGDSDPTNNTSQLVIDVIDRNDF
jgi:hypothetical protein